MPPKLVKKSQLKTRKKDHKINFEAIIGGKENPRFTAPIETESSSSLVNPLPGRACRNVDKTEIGMKTEKINAIKFNFSGNRNIKDKKRIVIDPPIKPPT